LQRRRVLVTGLGAVSAAGLGAGPLWRAVRDGQTAVRPVKFQRESTNRVKIAAQVPDFDAGAHFDASTIASCDRFTLFAALAAKEAVAQAGLSDQLGPRTAVIIGTGLGGAMTIDDQHYRYYSLGQRPETLAIPRTMSNAAASHVSMKYGAMGPVFAVSSACSSATQSIGIGAMLVRSGVVDRALVGGAETMITPSIFAAWEMLRVMTPDKCRPFSKKRNGMVLGEGAAVLVLEAEGTNTTPALAEIVGYGTTSDAKDLVRPDATGAAASMQAALDDARLGPDGIDYINAHGTGTVANDVTESEALRRVFGERLAGIPVSSSKPVHGHALGAAGALEMVVTIMALREGIVPPTLNCEEPDLSFGVDMVPEGKRAAVIRAAMSNSFAFGGINASLIVTPARA